MARSLRSSLFVRVVVKPYPGVAVDEHRIEADTSIVVVVEEVHDQAVLVLRNRVVGGLADRAGVRYFVGNVHRILPACSRVSRAEIVRDSRGRVVLRFGEDDEAHVGERVGLEGVDCLEDDPRSRGELEPSDATAERRNDE